MNGCGILVTVPLGESPKNAISKSLDDYKFFVDEVLGLIDQEKEKNPELANLLISRGL